MKYKNVVITGGAGIIGSNLVRKLSYENNVTVIDNLSTGHLKNLQDLIDSDKIKFIGGDITDLDLLDKIFREIDYVFHEAAIPSVPRSVTDPIGSNFANVNGTLNVLVAAKDNNVEKVVYASSSSVYGDTPTLPKKEDMNPCPMSPYAVSKLTGEYYCQVFTEVYNLPTVQLRYFNVYGPKQDPSSEYAAVIPKFITSTLEDKPPRIFGDGKQTRDFTFVDDVVNANILSAESKTCGVSNIASGKRISIDELAESIIEICGKNLSPVHEDPRPGDIKHSLADISKAKERINYEPNFNLMEGLKETIKWLQK